MQPKEWTRIVHTLQRDGHAVTGSKSHTLDIVRHL